MPRSKKIRKIEENEDYNMHAPKVSCKLPKLKLGEFFLKRLREAK